MRPELQRPRGTQDILPPDSGRMERLRRIAIDTAAEYGYDLVETPAFEQTPVFLRVGESTDIVQHERYSFTDAGGVDLTLRPEGTAAIARAYVENGLYNKPQPLRMCYYGPMFRREKPQALRYRQHTQFGAELYGSTNPEADAEVILLGCAVVEAMGIREPSVRLNSIGCGICRPAYRTSLIDYYQGRRDELCHDCQTRLESNPLRLLDCKVDVGIRNEAPDIQDYWCEDCRAHYQKLDDLLKKAGRIVRRDPYLVRGLDYYTRTVFEIGHPGMGDQTALFGGGRYDGLASTMDGPASTPAVGFGMGIERVLSVVDPELGAEPSPRTYIVHLPGFSDEAFEMAEQLRRHHLGVEADVMNRSLKAQLRDAGRRCTTVVFVGGQEWENGQVAVKDLLRNTQQTLSKDEILAYLQRLS